MWSSAHPDLPANSLRTGNLTGNFSGCGLLGHFSCPIDQINQRLAPQFPEPERTGNFFVGTGNFFRQNRELAGESAWDPAISLGDEREHLLAGAPGRPRAPGCTSSGGGETCAP